MHAPRNVHERSNPTALRRIVGFDWVREVCMYESTYLDRVRYFVYQGLGVQVPQLVCTFRTFFFFLSSNSYSLRDARGV